MTRAPLTNRVRERRERFALSQQELADRVGVSRQAIVAIEGGKQVPATTLALGLARTLRCRVEELFGLAPDADRLRVRLAPGGARVGGAVGRVVLGEVGGSWVAHGLPAEGTDAADAIVRDAIAEPLTDLDLLRRNVLVSGCAPVLGMLARRADVLSPVGRATWLSGSSQRSLDLLEAGLVHVAGVHLSAGGGAGHDDLVRARFPGERMLIVNLVRWREGFVVAPGRTNDIRSAEDLLRPGLRFARREVGAGAHRLVVEMLGAVGAEHAGLAGPEASGHVEVAQLVRCGAADVGVAIESVALAAGLGFVPLTEERFDLVVGASVAETPPVARFLSALDDPSFRREMAHLPGYDTALSGHVTTLEAA